MRRQHFTPLCRARRRPDARSSWGRGRNTGRSLVRFRASRLRLYERLVRSQAGCSTHAIKKTRGRVLAFSPNSAFMCPYQNGHPKEQDEHATPPPSPATPAGAEATQSGERPHPRSCMTRRSRRRVIASTTLRHRPETRTAEVRQHPGRPDHHRSTGERQWLQILYQARFGPNIVRGTWRPWSLPECGHERSHARNSVSRDPY